MELAFLPVWPLELNAFLVFGLLILAGLAGGSLASRTGFLPRITGFIAIGLLLGPSGLGIFGAELLGIAQHFVEVALGLILFQLGRLLDVGRAVRERPLLAAAALEAGLSFVLVFAALYGLGIAPLQAAVAAAIAISSSPAVVLLVVKELKAAGPLTERTLSLVAFNNLLSFFAFMALLPFMHYAQDAGWETIVLQPLYTVGVSLLLAWVMARLLLAIAARLGRNESVQFALLVGTIVGAVGLAKALGGSNLLTLLALGVLAHNLDRRRVLGLADFGHVGEIFFVILFVTAGANLHLADLAVAGWASVAFVAARFLGKSLGTRVLSPRVLPPEKSRLMGLTLLPMAGMAIGLTRSAAELYPQFAVSLSAIVLGAIAILETLGPVATEYALKKSGEARAGGRIEH